MKIFLNAIHCHEVTKTRRKTIIKKFFCLCVFVPKTPIRSKFTRHFSLDTGTIFVTKTAYFCQKAMDNLDTLFVKNIYKSRNTYNDSINNRLFFQLKSHTLHQIDQTLKIFHYRFYRLSHKRHNFCTELRQLFVLRHRTHSILKN